MTGATVSSADAGFVPDPERTEGEEGSGLQPACIVRKRWRNEESGGAMLRGVCGVWVWGASRREYSVGQWGVWTASPSQDGGTDLLIRGAEVTPMRGS